MGVIERLGPPSLTCHNWAWVALEPTLLVNERRNEILNLDVCHPTALDTIEGIIETVDQLVAAVPITWHNLATS